MRKPFSFPIRQGVHSRQAHADLPDEAIYEREAGRAGFFGPASHFHHQHALTGWSDWRGSLRPHAFDCAKLDNTHVSSPWQTPVLLSNQDCKIRVWQVSENMTNLVRNADGDELLFIHQGRAQLYCDYGHLEVNVGDYIVIPRSTSWRLEVNEPLFVLMIENSEGMYQLPERGSVGRHAVFDETVLDVPEINDAFRAQYSEQRTTVAIKRFNEVTELEYPFNPLDALGWHGDLSVVRLNWRDIRPLMSHRYHLPPSAHTTFVAENFVICTFVPRPIESDPGALKVPFYHSNDDYDEVLFYHQGDFFSRDGIEAGSITLHPLGFPHGPHPKAFQAGLEHRKTFADEVAVMIDTRRSLEISEAFKQVENSDYVNSWKTKEQQ
ncbi:homogentisate 1,2-dioxygenase [Vibrio sp. SCSIO 43136]|uniref:homogentisate 1,2-dioxygenase n=1 Tax=Vibrio sp. SCSIO 43136 TaxID=2819101 RepID=UPI0020750CE6|nr:homogentisate 1,2-dioxygenase [Vibrio sp. SCSIO 43136]USD63946.1 homogentisate 1,2-dioxygenase [Vibrio sp. SCSIO 43136]